jgi:hypothetical protein
MSHPAVESEPTRDFAWWRLAHMTRSFTVATRLVFVLVAGFVAVLVVGLVAVLAFVVLSVVLVEGGFAVRLAYGFALGLEIGLPVGLAAGLLTGLLSVFSSRKWSTEEPAFADLRLRGRGTVLVRMLAVWLVVVVMIVVAAELSTVLPNELLAVVTVVVPVGLAIGLIAGLTKRVEVPARAERPMTPVTSWRADRALHLLRVPVLGLGPGLAYGVAIGLTGPPEEGLVFGLLAWVVSGLVAGFAFGRHHAWLAYLIATYRLAWAGHLPRKLMPFLDDAHRLGLLRAVGPHYQFRHADLHDHLANTYQPPQRTARRKRIRLRRDR